MHSPEPGASKVTAQTRSPPKTDKRKSEKMNALSPQSAPIKEWIVSSTFAGDRKQSIGIFCFLLLFIFCVSYPAKGIQTSSSAIVKPSAQALELARRARREGISGKNARAKKLWNKAREIDPNISAPPSSWFDRRSKRFTASLKNRQVTRDELVILITLLPYKSAQKQLASYLARFPADSELRKLSLAMANLYRDHRIQILQDSAFNDSTSSNTLLYTHEFLLLTASILILAFIFRQWRQKDTNNDQAGLKHQTQPHLAAGNKR